MSELRLPIVAPLKCPDCGAPMHIDFKPRWWKREQRNSSPFVYLCQNYNEGCRGLMSAHQDGKPHGVPAPRATRQAPVRVAISIKAAGLNFCA